MDDRAAPPPYSETDAFSATGSAPNDSLTPTSSQDDMTTIHEVGAEHDAASVGDSTVPIPSYSASRWQETVAPNAPDFDPSTLDTFFALRPAPSQHIDTSPVHNLVLKERALQGDIQFPEPREVWMHRDVTRQDWAILVNLLLAHHTQPNDNVVTEPKFQTESVDSQLRQLSIENANSNQQQSDVDRSRGAGSSTKLSEQTSFHEQDARAQRIISIWNEKFFAKRGLHVILESLSRHTTKGQPQPHSQSMLDSNSAENEARDAGPSRGFSIGGWIRADSTGFHIGKSILSADSNGFRMFGNGLVADSRGFRLGNSLVADSNGFRMGGVIADSRGISTATGRGSDSGQMGQLGTEKGAIGDAAHADGCHPRTQLSPASSNVKESKRTTSYSSASSSTSSSSSDESEASEISIESLPDYDHLTADQLPLARSKVTEWLAHPERPVTAAEVHQLNRELRGTDHKKDIVPASDTPILRDEMGSLLRSFQKMMLTQKLTRRAEKRERRSAKRADKRQRRAVRRSVRAARREARREAKSKRRAEFRRQQDSSQIL